MMSRTLTALIASAAVMAWTPVADAANWVTSEPLSPPGKVATAPQIAVLPSGERVIAWVQNTESGFTPENVSIRTAPPGGGFGATQTIAGSPSSLQLATAPDGTVAIGWADFTAGTVHIARRAPGQAAFTDTTPFVVPGQEQPFTLDLAFRGADVFGTTITNRQSGGRSRSVWAVELAAGAATVTAAPGLGLGGSLDHAANDDLARQPEVFFDHARIAAEGDAVTAVWQREEEAPNDQTNLTRVERATQPAGGNRFPAGLDVDFQAGTGSFPPDMTPRVASGGGKTYVAWTRDRVDSIFFQDLSKPGQTQTIQGNGGFGDDGLRIAADGAGALVAVWESEPADTDNASVFSAVVPVGAAPGKGVPVTPIGIGREVGDLAVATGGNALVLPVRRSLTNDATLEVEGALRPGTGAFGAPETVSGIQDDSPVHFFDSPAAAITNEGRALALWSASDHDGTVGTRLFLSERDTTAPTFTAIGAPDSAVAGRRAAFSATATDDLSDPAISWDFGDGTQATGPNVTHVFGAAGAQTVTVTARDSAGNTTTQPRVVAVAPAPVDQGPPGDGGGGTPPPRDTTAPVVAKLTATNRTFMVGRGTTAVVAARKKKTPQGTALRMTLSERATLAVSIGLKKGKRVTTVGTLVRAKAGPGTVTLTFTGRIGKTALKPGSYVATVVAIDGAGNRSKPRTVNLTIVRK